MEALLLEPDYSVFSAEEKEDLAISEGEHEQTLGRVHLGWGTRRKSSKEKFKLFYHGTIWEVPLPLNSHCRKISI